MKLSKLLDINLTLFDGGDGASSGEGGGNSGVTGETMAGSVVTQQNNSGEEGTQDAVSTTNNGSDAGNNKTTLEERKKAFNELINGDYKDLYDEKIQKTLNRRFKETKELEKSAEEAQQLVDLLNTKYKLENVDLKTLTEAIRNDENLWAEAADEEGMTAEKYRLFQKAMLENAAMKRENEKTQRERFAEQQIQKWNNEASEVKKVYPEFDFRAEYSNPEFSSLLRAGVPMQHAYEVMHLDSVKAGVAQSAAKHTEKQIVDNVRSKGARPSENGVSSQSGFTVKKSVAEMSKEEFHAMLKRVEQGEIITLK